MLLAVLALVAGLALLAWSADKFVGGAAGTARHFGVPPLLIGMIVIGFGTSAPEMIVSLLAALKGNPGLALGNAYGSNISNIALILGVTAVISPVPVQSGVLRKELPLLAAATALVIFQLRDVTLSRLESIILLIGFVLLMTWAARQGSRTPADPLGDEVEQKLTSRERPLRSSLFWLAAGLVLLIASSRVLVWGAVEIAHAFGVSDLIIGLTVVAIGTSLAELAAAVAAARKGEHELALGNVIGSNIFNTLAVVGIAGSVRPFEAPREILTRDTPVMALLTLAIFILGYGFRGRPGRINRIEGGALLAAWLLYTGYLVASAL